MRFRELSALTVMLLLSGCLYGARGRTDQAVSNLTAQPYDIAPPEATNPPPVPPAPPRTGTDHPQSDDQARDHKPADSQTIQHASAERSADDSQSMDVVTSAYLQAEGTPFIKGKLEPKIPGEIPGSEATPVPNKIPDTPEGRALIEKLFPTLPPLPADPVAQLGPEGRPYTLADLQTIAAANSPELRQAASDVEAARGNLIQARTYQNPTVGWSTQPSNDGSQAALQGPFIDQVVSTGGKLKLASAAAEMGLRNAELALKRARTDLSTRVRNAYYAVLVAKETMAVNRAMARFTDEMYNLHAGLLKSGVVASYEPMAMRAQAYTARLSHKQSITNYIYAWKALVSMIGQRQLPLSQVAGRIDAVIPLYEFDTVLSHVLRNHTDVRIARNGIDQARYNLKLAQVQVVPDVEFNLMAGVDAAVPPKQFVHSLTIGAPIPLWNHNKGGIMTAEAALLRASEEPHRVELALTESLQTAYGGYKTNLDALDFYRRHILPDQVRAYRGVLTRRQIDMTVAFADVLSQQQTLATDVTNYLGILGSLWTSVVGVADLLQTNDLFQLAKPGEVPPVPDLEHLTPWPCYHPGAAPETQCQPGAIFGDPRLEVKKDPAKPSSAQPGSTTAQQIAARPVSTTAQPVSAARPADSTRDSSNVWSAQAPFGADGNLTPPGLPPILPADNRRNGS